MKKFVSLLGVSAAAFIATPAAAQVAAPAGPRVEAIVGYDIVSFDGEEEGGVLYGIGAGYDFAVGGMSLGLDIEATDATTDIDIVSAGRDLYAGARATFPVSNAANVYVKGGYTNARIEAEGYGAENGDGFRLGAGAQFTLSGRAYVGGEYRYSNYEADLSRHQFALTVGTRF